MSEDQANLEEDLFELAVQKPGPSERAAFLDGACRDNPALRARLDALLAAHGAAHGFMTRLPERAASGPLPTAPTPPVEAPSQRLGRYKLLEKIGEGGFGEVWMAEQREPVKRRVALKIIKLGMDSRQIVARFEAERQALAVMDHPNIAKFFDADVTDTGRPYFVMELVRGIRITEYCDQNQLPTRERLALFIKVCQAIQHAHQKGIIHRDIKPSNVLVTANDGPAAAGCPKVIDFGIAKATQGELTDKTVFTQFQQFIGTPAYISPEQAEMSPAGAGDIDTRADLYSLGVLLYELLVGQTPFDAKEMMKDGLDALVRTIREREPLRPSTRLNTLEGDARTTAAKRRQTDAGRLVHQLRGDLDWIVLKCLEKDRTRRYDTAADLAADLQRHLNNEPVFARPPSTAYRVGKWIRRNKLAFTAAAVVVLALVAGTGVSIWQAVEARRSRNVAEAARSAAQTALRMEASERQRAAASEQVAQGLLYVANLNLIQQAWDAGNLARIRQLLEETAGSDARGFEWYYWQRQAHLDLRTFRGHADRVWSAHFSPDGHRLVTTSDDGTARIWETSTGRELLTLPGHGDWVRCAVFSPDGSRIVTGSKDYIARVWDAATGAEILRLRGHRAAIRTVDYFADGRRIVTASQDGTARIWDAETGRQLLVLRGHSNWVFSAASSPDGRRIVTSGDDASARIWDADNGREWHRLMGHAGNVRTAAFSPDGRQVVTASADQTARVWDADSGRLLRTLRGHRRNVFSASFSPDGRRIVTASGDQTIRIWDVESGRELNQFKGHGSEVYTAVFSKDGRLILSASEDATARLWDAAGPPAPLPLEQGGSVFDVAISPDSQRIATGGSIGHVKIWSAARGELLRTLPGHDTEVRALAFSPDGQRIVAGHGDGNYRVWRAADGRLLLTLPGHVGGVNSVAFSTDGKRIVTSGSEGRVKVWSAEDGRELLSLPQTPRQTFSARFSPDRSRIVSGYVSGARVWDAQTGAELFTLIDAPHWVRSVSFSPDGRWVLTASGDKTARVWNASNGEPQLTLVGHIYGVFAASYSPDGKRIVTGSLDLSARVWNAATGQELLTLPGHTGLVSSVAFSPDGQRIVTGSLDGTALVWTAALPGQVAAWRQEQLSASNRRQAPPPPAMLTAEAKPFAPGLITRWLLLAPMNAPALDAVAVLDQEQIPDEAHLRPRAKERVHFPEKDLTWELVEQSGPLLDLNALVGQVSSPRSVAYAVCTLVTETPQSGVVFHITGDDECKVYLNGRILHRSNPARGYVLDEEKVGGVELPAGTNTLVFKIVNDTERWLGSIRVLDADGQPIPGLRVTLGP